MRDRDVPLYCDLPPDWQLIADGLGWTGAAIVNPAEWTRKAMFVLDFIERQGWVLVRKDEIEPIKHRWRWRRG